MNIDGIKHDNSISEKDLQVMVADYLRMKYPTAIFHSDFGSGVKLTLGQARVQSRQNGGRRAWPDIFIAAPTDLLHGLFIELKRGGTRLKKKNGDWATVHIAEQAEVLGQLRERGYEAVFACGFDEARQVIDNHMEHVKQFHSSAP